MEKPVEKQYDLVLIHGLRNTHRWSRAFLRRCVMHWGSGRVYVVYMNPRLTIWQRRYPEGTVCFIGTCDYRAGTETIEEQAAYLREKVEILRRECGLGRPLDVIAHSMGGLVLRKYATLAPGEVAAAVTLGTPHAGAPMAADFAWLGRGLRSRGAFDNLTPAFVTEFAAAHPWPAGVPLYTVRGVARGGRQWGVFGELWLGYHYHRRRGIDSDGLVPAASAVCREAEHLADLDGYNHLRLTRDPAVVDLCARVLP